VTTSPDPENGSLLARARDLLGAADPGGVRRAHGARTVLAVLVTFLTLEGLLTILGEPRITGAINFGVVAVFIDALAVSDPRRRDRTITLAWSVPVFAAVVALAAVTEPIRYLSSMVLLALVFLAFAARRFGLRAGELAIVAATGTYFADGAGVTFGDVPRFAAAAAVGVAWLALWELVLLPYDPVRSIRAATRSYAARIAWVVAGVSTRVGGSDPAGSAGGEASARERLDRDLRRVRLTRRVIEAQFPGARAPGGWTAGELTRLQVALYEAELGAGQMVEGTADRGALTAMPPEIRSALAGTLDAIAVALRNPGDPRHMETLAERANDLRDRVVEARATLGRDGTDGSLDPPTWTVAGLRIANGGRRIAHAVATSRSLQERTHAVVRDPPPPARAATGSAEVRMGGMSLHVTTALGLQAALATGLSMGVAWLAGVEHPNWVFWTSFVVIAGSLDESLRRVMQRVGGTALGVIAGVALAMVLPDRLLLFVFVASLAVFLAIYAAPVSHTWFVFWLNIAFAMGYAGAGGGTVELLVERPLMTILGGGVAALIVVRVLPIRRSDRYPAALVAFLSAIRDAVARWTTTGDPDGRALPAVDAAYRQVEVVSGARSFGTAFGEARQAANQERTELAALDVSVTRLGTAVELEPETARADLPAAVAARIDGNLEAAISLAGGSAAALEPTVNDLLAAARERRAPTFRGGAVLAAMVDVHGSVVQVGAALADRRDVPGGRSRRRARSPATTSDPRDDRAR